MGYGAVQKSNVSNVSTDFWTTPNFGQTYEVPVSAIAELLDHLCNLISVYFVFFVFKSQMGTHSVQELEFIRLLCVLLVRILRLSERMEYRRIYWVINQATYFI